MTKLMMGSAFLLGIALSAEGKSQAPQQPVIGSRAMLETVSAWKSRSTSLQVANAVPARPAAKRTMHESTPSMPTVPRSMRENGQATVAERRPTRR